MNLIGNNPRLATVIVDKGVALIQMPNGDILPEVVFTRVHDEVHEQATCLVKIQVNLKSTETQQEKK